jgi:hypothetical protein
VDFSLSQDVFFKTGRREHRFQIRGEVLNFTNLLSKDWGIGKQFNSLQPIIPQGADANGRPLYRFRNIGSSLLSPDAFLPTSGFGDVWRLQLSLRYIFD